MYLENVSVILFGEYLKKVVDIMSKYITKLPLIILSYIRLLFLKIFHFSQLHFHLLTFIDPFMTFEISGNGSCFIGENFHCRDGCRISIRDKGKLVIEDKVFLNSGCCLTCRESISIGSGTIFGQNVLIYDHDHMYETSEGKICGEGVNRDKFLRAPILIGKNSWIGSGCIILKGSHIGNNCIIAAGSIVKGDIEDGALFIQKRHRAKQI